MKLEFSAGDFKAEAWTEGHPMWLTIKHRGKVVASGIHHNEVRDLAYVLERMINAMRANLGENNKHEVD